MRTTARGAYAGVGLALLTGLGSLALLGPAALAPQPAAAPARPAPGGPPSAPAATRAPTSASPTSAPPASARAAVVPVVARGDGRAAVVPGSSAVSGQGPLRRYTVAVEGGLGVDPAAFARAVEATLADPRSWGADGRLSFRRVADGPVAFRVVLASPELTDRLCAPLRTVGSLSCANGDQAVINARRWLRGATSYSGRLPAYRQYVVNHEVGHTLGRAHERCPGTGRLAPVMVQQTKGVGSCLANPWPYP